MKKRFTYIVIVCISAVMLITKTEAAISINCNDMKIGIGTTIKITPTGNVGENINWTTSSPEIIEVNNGEITGKALGTAYISVNNNNSTDICKINVVENYVAINKLTIENNSSTITIGENVQLNPTISPNNASNKQITYISNDSNIATVNEKGLVTGNGIGTTYISIIAENKIQLYKVTVSEKIDLTGISIEEKKEITEEDTYTLSVKFTPENATNKNVTWKSSNSNVVTVDDKGNIKGVAEGTATITVTSADGAHIATSKITVKKLDKTLKSIKFNKDKIELEVGKTGNLEVVYEPTYASNKQINWSIDNTEIAKIENGKITAIKPGTAVIKAISEDGNHEAKCQLTVIAAPITSIKFSEEEYIMYPGDTLNLETISTPEYSAILNPIWQSSNEEIATIKDGMVIANTIGETTITISDKEGKITATTKLIVKERPYEELMISVEGYNLGFKPETKNYILEIGEEDKINININRNYNEYVINGNLNLKSGSIITIEVNDEEIKETYVIKIKKKPQNTIYFIIVIIILILVNILLYLNKKNIIDFKAITTSKNETKNKNKVNAQK